MYVFSINPIRVEGGGVDSAHLVVKIPNRIGLNVDLNYTYELSMAYLISFINKVI